MYEHSIGMMARTFVVVQPSRMLVYDISCYCISDVGQFSPGSADYDRELTGNATIVRAKDECQMMS